MSDAIPVNTAIVTIGFSLNPQCFGLPLATIPTIRTTRSLSTAIDPWTDHRGVIRR